MYILVSKLLTLHISRADGPRTKRFETYVVPLDPYEPTEVGCSRCWVLEIFDVES